MKDTLKSIIQTRKKKYSTKLLLAGIPVVIALILGFLLIRGVQAEGIPTEDALHYTGTLEEEGVPVNGERDFIVFFWSDATSEEPGPVCMTNAPSTTVTQGHFQVGLSDDCIQSIRENADLWVEVVVDDVSFGRERIGAVPYAVEADNGVPVGSIMAFFGKTPPRGWLVADGRVISSYENPEYSRLVKHLREIGPAYQGADEYDANLPDLRGRTPAGVHSSDSAFAELGETGGSKAHRLTVEEMPAHTHAQEPHNHLQKAHRHLMNPHKHTSCGGTYTTETSGQPRIVGNEGNHADICGSSHNATSTMEEETAINIAETAINKNTGGGETHSILSPYIVVNYIIKL